MKRPACSDDCQWATFVRNHDELTLDKLSESERQEVFAAFGPEERMQVFGRGLIRRLPPPMLDGDPRRIRMVYSLLFSLAVGTPVLFYGEEIGLGENLDAGGRMAVRPPCNGRRNATAGSRRPHPPEWSHLFPPTDSRRSTSTSTTSGATRTPARVHVDADPALSRVRSWWADMTVLEQPCTDVLAHQCSWGDGTMVALHNLGRNRARCRSSSTTATTRAGWSISSRPAAPT